MALRTQTPASRSEGSPADASLFMAIVVETFRFHGTLIALGNRLCAGSGLTSARWQVLGAIALAGRPLTVAQIARTMGLTRQSVQRLVDELEQGALVRRTAHPESRRARIVALTDAGASAYAQVDRRQQPWAARAALGIKRAALATTLRVLRALRERVETELRGGRRAGLTLPPEHTQWN